MKPPAFPITPRPTPRKMNRKMSVDMVTLSPPATVEASRSLFSPAKSTLGSGRSHRTKPVIDSSDEEIPIAPKKLSFSVSSSEDEEDLEPPSTPRGQMSKQLSFNVPASDDPEIEIKRAKLENPFVGSPSVGFKLPQSPKTHITYINNKTGEKFDRQMTKREMLIKPKKLDFSNI